MYYRQFEGVTHGESGLILAFTNLISQNYLLATTIESEKIGMVMYGVLIRMDLIDIGIHTRLSFNSLL